MERRTFDRAPDESRRRASPIGGQSSLDRLAAGRAALGAGGRAMRGEPGSRGEPADEGRSGRRRTQPRRGPGAEATTTRSCRSRLGALPGDRRRLRGVHQADALGLRADGGRLSTHFRAKGFDVKLPGRRLTLIVFRDERPFLRFAENASAGHDGLLQPRVQLAGALRLPQRAHVSLRVRADQHGDPDPRGDAPALLQHRAARRAEVRHPALRRRRARHVLRAAPAVRPERAGPDQPAEARGTGPSPAAGRSGSPRRTSWRTIAPGIRRTRIPDARLRRELAAGLSPDADADRLPQFRAYLETLRRPEGQEASAGGCPGRISATSTTGPGVAAGGHPTSTCALDPPGQSPGEGSCHRHVRRAARDRAPPVGRRARRAGGTSTISTRSTESLLERGRIAADSSTDDRRRRDRGARE